MLPHGGKAMVWGRVGRLDNVWRSAATPLYRIRAARSPPTAPGPWSFDKRVLAAGKTAPLGTAWHQVTMSFAGDTITVALDGKPLAEVKDAARPNGLVGLGTGWNEACFDNLRVFRL